MRFEAVIFYMDGVLVDSEPLHHRALNRVLARYGLHCTEEQGRALMGTTFRDTLKIVRSWLPGVPEESVLGPEYDRAAVEAIAAQARPRPGAWALVAALLTPYVRKEDLAEADAIIDTLRELDLPRLAGARL